MSALTLRTRAGAIIAAALALGPGAARAAAPLTLECKTCPSGEAAGREEKVRPRALPTLPWIERLNELPPECTTMKHFGDGLGRALKTAALVPLMVVPHPAFQWRPDSRRPYRASLSWPASLPFGPVTSTREHLCYTERFKSHRAVLEPGLVLGSPPVIFVRPSYRYLWHPAEGWMGIGAGLGSTWELTGPQGVRGSISPELLVQLGSCCDPGYWLLSVRFDRFLATTERSVLTAGVGITMW